MIATLLGGLRFSSANIPTLVGLYIASAYWFTTNTSFSSPAVTVAQSLSGTFAGIEPQSAPAFIAAQIVGAVAGLLVFRRLFR